MNATEIRMFAAATEIQSTWTPSLCDRVILKTDIYTDGEDYLGRWAFAEYDNEELRERLVWLPYQHQLQQLVGGIRLDDDPASIAEDLYAFMLPEAVCSSGWFCVRCGALGTYRRQTFKSMDVAMLGMVMGAVWDKYLWNGDWHERQRVVR